MVEYVKTWRAFPDDNGHYWFEGVTTSPTKGKITWKGTVRGDKIELRYVWVDASHWYKPKPKPLKKWAKRELKR